MSHEDHDHACSHHEGYDHALAVTDGSERRVCWLFLGAVAYAGVRATGGGSAARSP